MVDKSPIEELGIEDYSVSRREQTRYRGQIAAVRYLDPQDRVDALRLKAIITSPAVGKWMKDLKMTDQMYIDWMSERGPAKNRRHHLFAVSASQRSMPKDIGEVQGFVYFYFGSDERKQVRRVVEEGILSSEDIKEKRVLEISYAKSPDAPRGRMVGGVMQSCLEVSKVMQRLRDTAPTNILILAYTDPENELSERVAVESGFVKIGTVSSYSTENKPNTVFLLDWNRLHSNMQSAAINQGNA